MSEKAQISLYDFLYIDFQRVKSVYSQLNSGLLKQIDRLAGESISDERKFSTGVAPIGPISSRHQKEVSESSNEQITPHDIILCDVLAQLNDMDYILRDLNGAKEGNIVLLKGPISILDFGLYEKFVESLPAIAETFVNQAWDKRNRKERKKETKKLLAFVKSISALIPWSIGLIIKTSSGTAWGNLNKHYFRESPGNIILKHGGQLKKEWYILGIVDVLPGYVDDILESCSNQFIDGIVSASSAIKNMAGMPVDFFGITPILLFRKILAPTK